MSSHRYKILYVGSRVHEISGGADRLNERNIKLLEMISDGNIDFIDGSNQCTIWDRISFHIGGVTYSLIDAVMDRLACITYKFIFFSSSVQGTVIKKVKHKYPHLVVICNFHNIDRQFASEMLRVSGIKYLPFYLRMICNERLACKYMDYSFVLNERDAFLMESIYKRKSDLILPIANEDSFDENKIVKFNSSDEIIYLFVGVSFFANIEAVKWFINNVLPNIPGRLVIVGKGMDDYKKQLQSERVEVHGFVKDLSSFYYRANIFVSPIRSGGGMKTKVAEALMYGKTILGSTESFQGYRIDSESTFLCDEACDYIQTIHFLTEHGKMNTFNQCARNLFNSYYSLESVKNKFLSFFDSIL